MAEYTPTITEDPALEEVRGWYIDGRRTHNPFASDAALVERFDSWLADRDREIAERAWAEGAKATEDFMDGPDWGPSIVNPYRKEQK